MVAADEMGEFLHQCTSLVYLGIDRLLRGKQDNGSLGNGICFNPIVWEAVSKAASMVAPHGLLTIALYRKTHMDSFWKLEKRLYAHAPQTIQRLVRAGYIAVFRLAKLATGSSFREYVANCGSSRGMNFYHDVHDWLGGYPYETALAPEVDARLAGLGFKSRARCRPYNKKRH
jgi:hypothetical protein